MCECLADWFGAGVIVPYYVVEPSEYGFESGYAEWPFLVVGAAWYFEFEW